MKKYIFLLFIISALLSVVYGHPPIFVNSLDDAITLQKQIDHDILLIFSSKTCSFCQNLQDDLPSMNLENKIICVIDIDNDKILKKQYRVSIIPDTRIISDGIEKKKLVGYKDKQTFIDKIQ
jgi:thioredoxin-like negative regulator of GroEL